jgi:septal ring factor EnvC (AmiA/AmiB activator)
MPGKKSRMTDDECRFAWLIIIILILIPGSATAAEAPLAETRSALEKWVETRQLVSKVKSDWQADKETIQQTIQLFERELKAVEEQMSKVSTNSVQVDKERAEAEASQKASKESLERSREFAAGFERQLVKLAPQLPVPLQDIIKPLLNRLPSDAANTKMTAAERVQLMIGILNEVDKFNNGVAIFSEKRKNAKDEELSVETVYVGLGAAYFVSDSGDFAGMGTVAANGWEWTIKSDLADSVREIIRIYKNERPARFVALPAVIR